MQLGLESHENCLYFCNNQNQLLATAVHPSPDCFTECLSVLQVRCFFKKKVQERDAVVRLVRMQVLLLRGKAGERCALI